MNKQSWEQTILSALVAFLASILMSLVVGCAMPPSYKNKPVSVTELAGDWDVWVDNRGEDRFLNRNLTTTPVHLRNLRRLVLGNPGDFHAVYANTKLDSPDIKVTWESSKPNGRWRLADGNKIYLDFNTSAGDVVTDEPISGKTVTKEEDGRFTIEVDEKHQIFLHLFKREQNPFRKKWDEMLNKDKQAKLLEEKTLSAVDKAVTNAKEQVATCDTKEAPTYSVPVYANPDGGVPVYVPTYVPTYGASAAQVPTTVAVPVYGFSHRSGLDHHSRFGVLHAR